MKLRKTVSRAFQTVDGMRRAAGKTTGKAVRALAGRVKAWEGIDEQERNSGAFKKPGALRP